MKPIKLTIAGLHSFRQTQEVDFTLVSDTGLFGIFGPTGSGKSSILDAITLALYGKVERSDRNRTGILNQLEDKIQVSFTFELSTGREKERYTVERIYKGNKENRVRSELARIITYENEKEIVLADKETEVTKEVIEITGLTDDDFTRAVVLPQGKFAEFLTLKAQDRRPMLERLFNLDKYGRRLKEKAQKRENQLKRKRDDVLVKQQMLEHASKEKLDELKEQLNTATKEKEEIEKENEVFQQEYQQMELLWETQKRLIEARKQLQALAGQEKEISQMEVTRKKAEIALAIAPTLKRHQKLEQELRQLQQEIQKRSTEVEGLRLAVKEKEQTFQQNKIEAEAILPKLQEKVHQLETALQQEQELVQYEEKDTSLHRKLEELFPKNEQVEKSIADIQLQVEQSELDVKKLKEKRDYLHTSIEEREKIDQGFQIVQDIRNQKNLLEDKKQELVESDKKLEALSKQVEKEKERCNEEEQKLQELEQQIEEQKKKQISDDEWYQQDKFLAELEMSLRKIQELDNEILVVHRLVEDLNRSRTDFVKKLEQKEKQHQAFEEELAKSKNQLTKLEQENQQHFIAKLGAELEEGMPCMVCGSKHHPKPVQLAFGNELTDEVNELKDSIVAKENEYTKLRLEIQSLVDKERHLFEELEKEKNRKRVKEEEFKGLFNSLPVYYQKDEVDLMFAIFQEEKEAHQHLKEKMKDEKEQLENRMENQSILKDALQQIKNKQLLLEQEHSITLQSKDKISKEMTVINTKVKELEKRLKDLDSTFTMTTVEEKKKEIQGADKEREELGKRLEDLEATIKKLLEQEKNQRELLNTIEKEETELQQLTRHNATIIKELKDKLQQITAGQPAKSLLRDINQQRETINQKLKTSEEEWKGKNELLTNQEKELSSKQAVEGNLKEQFVEIKKELEQLMDRHQIDDLHFVEKHLLADEDMKKIEKSIKEYHDQKFLYLEKEKQYVDELKGKEISEEDWNHYLQQKEQLNEKLEGIKDRVRELSYQYKQLEENYQSYRKLEKERRAIQQELDIASELNQVLRGNAFVDFIAIEYLKNITAIASDKLMKLTRNRYSLRVEQDGTFYMIDELNGGLARPVNTLSGGETFITSLSLALALSSQIQLKGGRILEFFFLDEGFGSLDNDLLDTVMMTLEKLLSGHMIIGIISHVPELQNRINRKFIVAPADGMGNGSKVKLEY